MIVDQFLIDLSQSRNSQILLQVRNEMLKLAIQGQGQLLINKVFDWVKMYWKSIPKDQVFEQMKGFRQKKSLLMELLRPVQIHIKTNIESGCGQILSDQLQIFDRDLVFQYLQQHLVNYLKKNEQEISQDILTLIQIINIKQFQNQVLQMDIDYNELFQMQNLDNIIEWNSRLKPKFKKLKDCFDLDQYFHLKNSYHKQLVSYSLSLFNACNVVQLIKTYNAPLLEYIYKIASKFKMQNQLLNLFSGLIKEELNSYNFPNIIQLNRDWRKFLTLLQHKFQHTFKTWMNLILNSIFSTKQQWLCQECLSYLDVHIDASLIELIGLIQPFENFETLFNQQQIKKILIDRNFVAFHEQNKLIPLQKAFGEQCFKISQNLLEDVVQDSIKTEKVDMILLCKQNHNFQTVKIQSQLLLGLLSEVFYLYAKQYSDRTIHNILDYNILEVAFEGQKLRCSLADALILMQYNSREQISIKDIKKEFMKSVEGDFSHLNQCFHQSLDKLQHNKILISGKKDCLQIAELKEYIDLINYKDNQMEIEFDQSENLQEKQYRIMCLIMKKLKVDKSIKMSSLCQLIEQPLEQIKGALKVLEEQQQVGLSDDLVTYL